MVDISLFGINFVKSIKCHALKLITFSLAFDKIQKLPKDCAEKHGKENWVIRKTMPKNWFRY